MSNCLSQFRFIHTQEVIPENEDQTSSLLVWKTCQRQIIFLDQADLTEIETKDSEQLFSGLDAEVFLAEVLSGLKSPLIGETEVFGQFKFWWSQLSDESFWKKQNRSRIESIFALVKTIREKVFCGQGSQSYGSLLRKHLVAQQAVDIIGAGLLAQEIVPWVQGKSAFRIWCRDPQKVLALNLTKEVFDLDHSGQLSKFVVVAAPLSDVKLNRWLQAKGFTSEHRLFDFRPESATFTPFVQPHTYIRLNDFFEKTADYKNEMNRLLDQSQQLIAGWKFQQENKMQIRPFGWEDVS